MFRRSLSRQHVDGAGKVDGSVVVALPIDRWSAPEHVNAFEGGGLTFWDGKKQRQEDGTFSVLETHYDTRSGDVAFIDRYVYSMCFDLRPHKRCSFRQTDNPH